MNNLSALRERVEKGRSEMRAGLREARAKIKELEAALARATPSA